MFSKDRNDSSLEQHRGVRLGLKNVRIWVKDIVENRSMHYEEAGTMVRQGKAIAHREPTRGDRVSSTDPKDILTEFLFDDLIITVRADAEARVTLAGGDAAAITLEQDRVEALVKADYHAVYTDDLPFKEDYKDYRDKLRSLVKYTPLLIVAITDSINSDAEKELKANPAYVAAKKDMNILALLQAAENVLGRTGKYSFVATEAAYDKLTQGGLSWHEYSKTRTRNTVRSWIR